MKIGILTQPLLNNYGGLLQNYALQQALIRLGHEPITIDQKPKDLPSWYVFLGRIKGMIMYLLSPEKHKRPKYSLNEKEKKIIEFNTKQFIERSIIHTKECVGAEEFRQEVLGRGIEALVVGSDQCWRPMYNNYIEDMFFQFATSLPIKKRIAYAASFGTDQWEYTPELTRTCAELVRDYDLVTVRESSGIELCKKYFGADAKHVLDPTMLLTREDYEMLIAQYEVNNSEGDMFNYILDPTQRKMDFINNAATVLDLKPFQVLPKYNEDHRTKKQVKNEIESCVYPSPAKWVRAFMDSKMTVVDSFHGMVFSIIFNKPFWVIGNQERGMSRFISLLNLFGLSERLISEDNLAEVDLMKPIDYENVNSVWREKRNESLNYLKNALG